MFGEDKNNFEGQIVKRLHEAVDLKSSLDWQFWGKIVLL